MSLLMLGLQTNRQGQHYSEQSDDPPNSSLSLKQTSDHSSTTKVVLNCALLYLCIAWSGQCMYTHLPVYTHAHVRAYACRLVTGELLNALTPSLISSSSQHISPFVIGELMFFLLWPQAIVFTFFTTQRSECKEQKLHFIAETSGWWVDYPIKCQTFSGSSMSKIIIFFFSLCCVSCIWICGYLTFDLTNK